MSEQMRNVEPHARLSGNKIIYPISMNREDLSKLSKQQLISMLLGKQTVSVQGTKTRLHNTRVLEHKIIIENCTLSIFS